VTHENRVYAEFSQEWLLLRECHGDAVRVFRQDPCPPLPPGPQLRGDIVQHRDAGPLRRYRQPQVEARVVDGDDQVGGLLTEEAAQAALQRQEERQAGNDLDEAHDDEPVEIDDRFDTGLGHARSRQSEQVGVWIDALQFAG
jgi:hypothetical protein